MGKVYQIPPSKSSVLIFFRYVKKVKEQGPDVRMCPMYNSMIVFTAEQEALLQEYLQISSKMRYGLIALDCRRLAFETAMRNKIVMPDTWKDNKRAGKEWIMRF